MVTDKFNRDSAMGIHKKKYLTGLLDGGISE